VRQNIVVYLPEDWPVKDSSVKVDNPAFRYEGIVRYSARTLEITYSYEALADHVPTEDLRKYLSDRKKVYDDIGYVLSMASPDAPAKPLAIAPVPLFALLASLALGTWFTIRYVYRWDPPPREADSDAPEGLGGWLILPTLTVIASPFIYAWLIFASAGFVDAEVWHRLPDLVGAGYETWAQPLVLVLVGFAPFLIVLQILLYVLFFRKRSSAPVAFIAINWATLMHLTIVASLMLIVGLDEETKPAEFVVDTIRDIAMAGVWTAYMLRAQRARATFRQRLVAPVAIYEPASNPA
jgi:hypothetical protein